MQNQIDELNSNLEECKTDIHQKLEKGHDRMNNFESNLTSIERKLDIVLELHDDFKGFFKVMGWIGKMTVWVTKVSAVLGAAYYVLKEHLPW